MAIDEIVTRAIEFCHSFYFPEGRETEEYRMYARLVQARERMPIVAEGKDSDKNTKHLFLQAIEGQGLLGMVIDETMESAHADIAKLDPELIGGLLKAVVRKHPEKELYLIEQHLMIGYILERPGHMAIVGYGQDVEQFLTELKSSPPQPSPPQPPAAPPDYHQSSTPLPSSPAPQ